MEVARNCSNPLRLEKHRRVKAYHKVAHVKQQLNSLYPERLLSCEKVCKTCLNAIERWIRDATAGAPVRPSAAVSPPPGPSTARPSFTVSPPPGPSTASSSKTSVMSIILPRKPSEQPSAEQKPVTEARAVDLDPGEQVCFFSSGSPQLQSEVAPGTSSEIAQRVEKIPPIKTEPQEDLELMDLESLTEESKSSSPDDPEVNKDLINISLQTAGVTPICDLARRQHANVSKKFLNFHKKIKKTLLRASGSNIAITPVRECSSCKQLCRQLPARFKEARSKAEKYQVLTTLPKTVSAKQMISLTGCSSYMARTAVALRRLKGAFVSPEYRPINRGISCEMIEKVVDFYNDDQNSRVVAGERNSIMSRMPDGKKQRMQKRLILLPLRELYANFLLSPGYKEVVRANTDQAEIHVSKFASLRPDHCIWPGRSGHHTTCVCVIHENFRLLREAADLAAESLTSFLDSYLCSEPKNECYLRLCSDCPKYETLKSKLEENLAEADDVCYFLWTSTDLTDLVEMRERKDAFITRFLEYFPKISAHQFVTTNQNTFIKDIYTRLHEEKNSVLCQVDFGMNYTFVSQQDVQSVHFSPPQATVHPFVVYGWSEDEKKVVHRSYVVLSDELNHNTLSFRVFQAEVMGRFREDFPDMRHIYYVSDGSAAQYKNYKNLSNLLRHNVDFNLTAEWHFTATGHGKSACDAITGVVKRTTRLESLKDDKYIRTAQRMFEYCQTKWENSKNLKFILVTKSQVAEKSVELEQRYAVAKVLSGIQEKHSFVVVDEDTVAVRRFSHSVFYESFKPFGVNPTAISLNNAVGEYVAVRFEDTFTIGIVEKVDEVNNDVTVKMMRRSGKKNLFSWPLIDSFDCVSARDCLQVLQQPTTATKTGKFFRITEFKDLNQLMRRPNVPTEGPIGEG